MTASEMKFVRKIRNATKRNIIRNVRKQTKYENLIREDEERKI